MQPPHLDQELAAALAARGGVPAPLTADGLARWQQQDAARRPRPTLRQLADGGRFETVEHDADGTPVVAARPAGADGPLPVLLHLHGGGLIGGNAYAVLPRVLRELAQPLGLAVLSVDYPLAPAARYPVPLHACRTALHWAVRHAERLRIDPGRIVLSGKSAGGGLAAALALLLRDGGGPAPLGQLLLSPMLDDRGSTASARQAAGHDTWDAVSNATAWQAALGPLHRAPDLPPYAAPARARDLAGLPPAYLEVGSAETFRDEVTAYANALWRDGGRAELHVWPGACHGFDTLAPAAAVSRTAVAARVDWLRRLLGPGPEPSGPEPLGRTTYGRTPGVCWDRGGMTPCPHCSQRIDPTGPAVSTSFRDGPHRWIPVVANIHGWSPDFLWHPHCYAQQYGLTELERLIGDHQRTRLRHAPQQIEPPARDG